MQAFLAKAKRNVFLVTAAMLTLGLVAGLTMQNGNKAQAQVAGPGTQYFLEIDGIQGESTDRGHEGAIELQSFAWAKTEPGIEQTAVGGPGGGGGTGKAQVHDIHFTQQVSKASPVLMAACANGKHFKQAKLTVRKATGGNSKGKQSDYLVITLQDASISSYRVAGNDGATPHDEFTLHFNRMEFSYTPQKADGSADTPVVGVVDVLGER